MAGRRSGRWLAVVGLALSTLAACGGSGPGTPSPAVVPGSSPPTATAATDQELARLALAAFERAISDPAALTYHLSQRGSITVGGVSSGDYAYEADVSGRAFAGTIAATSAGQDAIQFEFVYTADLAYVRDSSGAWQAGPRNEATAGDIIDVWRYLGELTDLGFAGTTAYGAVPLLRFNSTKPIPYQTGQLREIGRSGTITALELQLTRSGVPVRLAFRAEVQAPVASQGEESVVTDSAIEFTRFGEAIEIKAPT